MGLGAGPSCAGSLNLQLPLQLHIPQGSGGESSRVARLGRRGVERPLVRPSVGPLCPVLCVFVQNLPCCPHVGTEFTVLAVILTFSWRRTWGEGRCFQSPVESRPSVSSPAGAVGGGSEGLHCSPRPAVGKSPRKAWWEPCLLELGPLPASAPHQASLSSPPGRSLGEACAGAQGLSLGE